MFMPRELIFAYCLVLVLIVLVFLERWFERIGKLYESYLTLWRIVYEKVATIDMVKASLEALIALFQEQLIPRDDKEKEEVNSYVNFLTETVKEDDITKIRKDLRNHSLPDWVSIYPRNPRQLKVKRVCSILLWCTLAFCVGYAIFLFKTMGLSLSF